ncbi:MULTISPECIES: hypothetical protein [unclassified Leptolyngbya]|uniref:hypothetical protein n=1 Tax=unclassified Leptolyngbya TaxID=2650499 RepID=UPI0016888865|nr:MULTISPECIES: hypothetical protein [unclassified Leptolyngbya]MBD1909129.1 hypothetical protein [Leptolyngbya sp. FACHB-8]MBD2157503.1 hypothetical protein [Leptolyngbya sp. FACHB-16]
MDGSIENLMGNVFNYFLSLYQQINSSAIDETFLAFEPIGTRITPNMFKLRSTDATYFDKLAVEQLSDLINSIPEIDANVFRRTIKDVDEMYGILLEGATPGTEDNGEVTLFNTLKSKAVRKFEPTVGYYQKPLQYRPSYAMPSDWYDASAEGNWTAYSTQMEEKKEHSSIPGKQPSPKLQLNPTVLKWKWQVLPDDLSPILEKPYFIDRISTSQILKQEDIRTTLPQSFKTVKSHIKPSVLNLELKANKAASFMARSLSPNLRNAALSEVTLSKAVLSKTAFQSLSRPKQDLAIKADVLEGSAISKNSISPIILEQIRAQIAEPAPAPTHEVVNVSLQSSALSVLLTTTSTQSVESKQLSLSFKYCLVNVDRPWLSNAFLSAKGWYVPGFEAGGFSTGTANNEGILPAVPIAFIAIKDLQISGWDNSESESVEKAVSFGPFVLVDRTIDKTAKTLTCSGIQVIGWVCQIMPFLPPLSDPDPR